MTEPVAPPRLSPAFYAAPTRVRSRPLRDWWLVLHPPYTVWHLSYVVIGGCLAPDVRAGRLVATLLAFLLAVGLGAHAFDELHGRPLRTAIPSAVLLGAGVFGVGAAVLIGVAGLGEVGPWLGVFMVVGVVLAVGYSLEMFGLHSDAGFAASWGAFPVLTSYFAQERRITAVSVTAAAFAFFFSGAQRHLSTPARSLRRKTTDVRGTATMADGTVTIIDVASLLKPLEAALRALTLATVTLAVALAILRFSG